LNNISFNNLGHMRSANIYDLPRANVNSGDLTRKSGSGKAVTLQLGLDVAKITLRGLK
jgi:hypothetical protein